MSDKTDKLILLICGAGIVIIYVAILYFHLDPWNFKKYHPCFVGNTEECLEGKYHG